MKRQHNDAAHYKVLAARVNKEEFHFISELSDRMGTSVSCILREGIRLLKENGCPDIHESLQNYGLHSNDD